MSTNEITVAGEVVISKLNIIPSNEKSKVDITGLMMEMNIFEDIFSPTVSGHIILVEAFNLIHDLPIIGEEKLEVELYTPSMEKITKIFYIYKIPKKLDDRNSKHVYQLNFVSYESLIDLNTKISKAYTGTPDKIVKEICKKYLTNSTIDADVSVNPIKFISPYWSPFKAISYASSRAVLNDKFETPDFLFYESNKGYHFKSLSNLYQQNEKTEYFYDKNQLRLKDPSGGSTRDIEREYKTIESFKIINNADYIQKLLNGTYSFKVFGVNILNKTIKKNVYNYLEDFDKSKHLGKSMTHSDNLIIPDQNGRIEIHYTNPYVHNTFKKDISDQIISRRLPLLSQSELLTIEIVVPGRTDIKVGDLVKLNIGNLSTRKTKFDFEQDKYKSGKYLISAIRHRFTQTRHKMIMNIIKDSFESDIAFGEEL